jgi:hypothetical protein
MASLGAPILVKGQSTDGASRTTAPEIAASIVPHDWDH